ncbi:alpha/beta hydrolase [Kitasatospora sp. NPDC004669]|uniref:alpha/beta fold hydrolase n=1 Tax=Kitasatospora sp. NPDC004669 TaxID=3154555 RepID=UPI0033B29A81
MSSHRFTHRKLTIPAAATAIAAAAGLAAVALLGPTAQAAPALTHPGGKAKPTIVLVHGAWGDASGWSKVTERLQHDGYTVIAPADPLRGLAQESTYLHSLLKTIEGPVVLVGHSYGGAVISQAAVGDPQVKALVYISAFVPDQGETLGALAGEFPGSQLQPALRPVPFANADGTGGADLYVNPADFRAVLAADVPAEQTVVMATGQRPIDAAVFGQAPTAVAWHTVPSWALVATEDKALPPALERFEARRAHSHTVEVDSSHFAMVSHPEQVTDLIEDAAHATAGR